MEPTRIVQPRRLPALVVVAVVAVGIVLIVSDSPAANFWGLVLAVFAPILWGVEYMPPAPTPTAASSQETRHDH